MEIEDLPLDQVDEAIGKIEACFRTAHGEVDMLKMANEQNIYKTYVGLSRRKRAAEKEKKVVDTVKD